MGKQLRNGFTRCWRTAVAAVLSFYPVAVGFAQSDSADSNAGAQVIERSYAVDIAVLVVLVGIALFAVCRSSNRS